MKSVSLLPALGRDARLTMAMAAMFAVLGVFLAQAFRIQVVQGSRYRAMVESGMSKREVLRASRGRLLDRNGELLAGNAEYAFRTGGRDGKRTAREMRRIHPWQSVGAVVLGNVNRDGVGTSGLEQMFNDSLRGVDGWRDWRKDARGREVDLVEDGEKLPVPGRDVVLTIDRRIQAIAEGALRDGVEAMGASRGVAIVLQPYTGEILAMASYPGFDPDNPESTTPERLRNDAIAMTYEPGSVAKGLTAAVALENGLVSEKDTFDVSSGCYRIYGNCIRDSHKMGRISFAEAIAQSSNVAFAQLSERIGSRTLYKYLTMFGIGMATGIPLRGEERGQLRNVKDWSGVSLPTIAFGHEFMVTPLQVTLAYGAIANGGKLMEPRLVREIRDGATGETLSKAEPEARRRVISSETAARLRTMMAGVVAKGGTAGNLHDPRFPAAGKTGTAEKYVDGVKRRDLNVASFVGMFPVDNPELVVYAMVDEPKVSTVGGRAAGPIFRNIMERIRFAPELGGTPFALEDRVAAGIPEGERAKAVPCGKTSCDRRPGAPQDLVGWPLREAVEVLERRGWTVTWEGEGRVAKVETEGRKCLLKLQEAA